MSTFKDDVPVQDSGFVRLIDTSGVVTERAWKAEQSVVEMKNWVTIIARERGKIVGRREGHNVWTNTGREYLAMLMSIETGSAKYRTDSIAYIGAGSGSQVEDPGVLNLSAPVAYAAGLFLAALDIPPTFPLLPSRTTVRFHRTFIESEITLSPGSQVMISELGLFTNGSPSAVPIYNPGTRDRTLSNATQQSPAAYKSFEPLGKTDGMQLEVAWEIRF
jgi:hypothetical protein